MVHGEISEHFPIQLDVAFLQLADELAIGETVLACSGIDPLHPELPHLSFFLSPIPIGVLEGPFMGVLGQTIDVLLTAEVTFRPFEDLLSVLLASYWVFRAGHGPLIYGRSAGLETSLVLEGPGLNLTIDPIAF